MVDISNSEFGGAAAATNAETHKGVIEKGRQLLSGLSKIIKGDPKKAGIDMVARNPNAPKIPSSNHS